MSPIAATHSHPHPTHTSVSYDRRTNVFNEMNEQNATEKNCVSTCETYTEFECDCIKNVLEAMWHRLCWRKSWCSYCIRNRIRFCEFNLRANINATRGLNSNSFRSFVRWFVPSYSSRRKHFRRGILTRFKKWPSSSECTLQPPHHRKYWKKRIRHTHTSHTTHQYSFGEE